MFLLAFTRVSATADALVATLGTYPEFTGDVMTGTVSVSVDADSGSLKLTYNLAGLEVDTTGGLHIHSGYTCASDALVGGHYYSDSDFPDSDPWTTTWASDSSGVGEGSFEIDVQSLNNLASNVGHIVVAHLEDGTKAACGVLKDLRSLRAAVATSNYAAYTGSQDVQGDFFVSSGGDGLTVGIAFSGLEAGEVGGVHIHEGMSCADDVGAHWYSVADDPWDSSSLSTWESDADGNSVKTFTIDSGYNGLEENIGHTVVVHLADGTKAACGILQPVETVAATLGPYPEYTGASTITGDVLISMSDDGLEFTYSLFGLETATTGGIHIHVGSTCATNDEVAGHYWDDQDGTADDTWTSANDYTSDAQGRSRLTYLPASGYETLGENVGHTVVVHDNDGTRAACGVFNLVLGDSDMMYATMEEYPGYASSATSPTGTVEVSSNAAGDLTVMTGNLADLEASETGGAHVHVGTTCATNDDVAGHYYDEDDVAEYSPTGEDPWNDFGWTSNAAGEGSAPTSQMIDSGYNLWQENVGRAVVVHLADGTRASCGILTLTAPEAPGSSDNDDDNGKSKLTSAEWIAIFAGIIVAGALIVFLSNMFLSSGPAKAEGSGVTSGEGKPAYETIQENGSRV